MKFVARTAALSAVFGLAAACGGSEGPAGPAGAAPEMTFEAIAPGDTCAAGGTEIYADGELVATICDGAAGQPGQAGQPGAAGSPGAAGKDGSTPEIDVERVDEHEDCDAGGLLVTVSVDEEEISEKIVCDGEDGQAPVVNVRILNPDPEGPCVDGGVEVIIISDGRERAIPICGAEESIGPDVVIEECILTGPNSILLATDESAELSAQAFIPGYTDIQRNLPADFEVEVGVGNPDSRHVPWMVEPGEDDWDWFTGAAADFDGDQLNFTATVQGLDKGHSIYAFRMREDSSAEWVYCGVSGIIPVIEGESPSTFTKALFVAEPILGWDATSGQLDITTGSGEAALVPGTDEDGSALSDREDFTGSTGDKAWTVFNWLESDDFFNDDEDIIRDRYFNFTGDLGDYEFLTMNISFRTSGTGPDRFLIAGEFADGRLEFLPEPVEFQTNETVSLKFVYLPLVFGWDGDVDNIPDNWEERPVAYRLYPYNASHPDGAFGIKSIEFLGY